MKDYTSKNPVFHDMIKIVDADDPDHADYINIADKQNFENTLALKKQIDQFRLASEEEVEELAKELMESSGLPEGGGGQTEEGVRTATESEIDDVLAGLDEILG